MNHLFNFKIMTMQHYKIQTFLEFAFQVSVSQHIVVTSMNCLKKPKTHLTHRQNVLIFKLKYTILFISV